MALSWSGGLHGVVSGVCSAEWHRHCGERRLSSALLWVEHSDLFRGQHRGVVDTLFLLQNIWLKSYSVMLQTLLLSLLCLDRYMNIAIVACVLRERERVGWMLLLFCVATVLLPLLVLRGCTRGDGTNASMCCSPATGDIGKPPNMRVMNGASTSLDTMTSSIRVVSLPSANR